MISIGDLPGGLIRSEGRGISGDGNTIVGGSFVVGNRIEAFRWTQAEGMISIHDPTTNLSSVALDVSHDGRVIVGQLQDGNPYPFRWTPAQGMVPLPVLPTATYGQALAVSANGLFTVGSSIIGQSGVATIWNSPGNPRSIQLMLTQDFGLNLAGWQLSEASGISADGRVIVGNGIGPDGRIQAWRAEIPVPEPLFGLWLSLLVPITATRRRRPGVIGG